MSPEREPRCAVRGCGRAADTVIDGDDVRTGRALPTAYACDKSEHQYAVALALMPEDARVPNAMTDSVLSELVAWNEREAER